MCVFLCVCWFANPLFHVLHVSYSFMHCWFIGIYWVLSIQNISEHLLYLAHIFQSSMFCESLPGRKSLAFSFDAPGAIGHCWWSLQWRRNVQTLPPRWIFDTLDTLEGDGMKASGKATSNNTTRAGRSMETTRLKNDSWKRLLAAFLGKDGSCVLFAGCWYNEYKTYFFLTCKNKTVQENITDNAGFWY